jgi:hypothetical protein
MSTHPSSRPATSDLHRRGAFVVQFRTGSDFELGVVEGRVEHVASGRTAQFESVAELTEIIGRMLKDVAQEKEGQA